MTFTKKLIASTVAAATVTAASFAPVANAELSASAGIATSYLWRGIDLGQGTPAFSADLSVSREGFYAGTWVSSGDSASGTEYDLYAGYGGEVGMFSYDISIWNYLYPQGGNIVNGDGSDDISQEDTVADLSEVILSIGVGPISVSWYENVAANGGDESYRYYTIGASLGQFSATVGHHDTDSVVEGDGLSMTHADVSYAYNDNLSFTLSQVIKDNDDSFDDDLKLVASYSIPLN